MYSPRYTKAEIKEQKFCLQNFNEMNHTLTRSLRRKAKSSIDRVTLENRPRISSAELRKLICFRVCSSSRWSLSAIRLELNTSFSVCWQIFRVLFRVLTKERPLNYYLIKVSDCRVHLKRVGAGNLARLIVPFTRKSD